MTKAMLPLLALVFVLLSHRPASSQRAWLPPQGQFSMNLSYIFETFDEFWLGKTKMQLPADVDQHTFSVGFAYGLWDDITFDLTVGYTHTAFAPEDDREGLDDTTMGVRWRMVDEFKVDSPYIPTLTLRLGGIVAGTYDTGAINDPGDGASGIEMALLFAKAFGATGFGSYGDIGYRYRMEGVPDDFFASVSVYKTFLERLTVSFGYRRTQGLSGLDIGGPGFTPARFPDTKEMNDTLEAGLGYTDKGGRHYGVIVARTIDGRNTPQQTAVGILLHVPF